MILADKIILLRKKAGWSQEELAERLNVTRQSVSKWESAQSTPDLDRILQLARLFEVSTDSLLKDEYDDAVLPGRISDAENQDSDTAAHEEKQPLRRVSMEEANQFLGVMRKYSSVSANAFAMYVVSPVVLLTLGGLTERKDFALSENSIAVIGIVFLLLCVAAATVLLIGHSQEKEHFAYLEKEDIDTEYGVDGLAREYRQTYEEQYRNGMMCGFGICILAAVPSICIALLPEEWGLGGMMVSLTLVMIACAVRIFAYNGTLKESCDILLEENDYTREKKHQKRQSRLRYISGIYWLIITAIYLGYSFVQNDWNKSWIIWPVAGVLYAALAGFVEMLEAGHHNTQGKRS